MDVMYEEVCRYCRYCRQAGILMRTNGGYNCSPVQCYLMSPLWTSRRRLRHYSDLSGKTSTIIGCYCGLKLKRQSRYHRNLIFLSVWRCNCETWIRNNSIPIFVDILIELDNLNLRTTVDNHWFWAKIRCPRNLKFFFRWNPSGTFRNIPWYH